MKFHPISISFSPNTEPDDVSLVLKLLFQPLKWQRGKAIKNLEETFKNYLGVKYAFSFNSGRSALLGILVSMGVQEEDEVLLQAFTCNAVVNPILTLKAKPVFVDIDDSLNLDPKDFKKKITKNSRAVIIQHTFGNSARIGEIKNICQKNNLFLIEDCAHSLGAEYEGKKVGSFGDAAFFSFGRDKVISSVYGGMAVTNNNQIGQKLEIFQKTLDFPSRNWILKQLLHPISFAIALPLYSLKIGKAILFLKQNLKILSPSVYPEEKRGELPKYFPKKMPNAMAIMAQKQFQKLERFNKHRKEIAEIYNREFARINMPIYADNRKFEKVRICVNNGNTERIYMRYSIFTERANEIREKLKEKNIFLNDGWHSQAIVPPGTDLEKMQYQKGSCPKAEKVSKEILNLPTSIKITKKDAEKIIKEIKLII